VEGGIDSNPGAEARTPAEMFFLSD
jgi:hypothetical protein